MSSPLQTYPNLYLHVTKLTGRSVLRGWPALFAAPIAAIGYELLTAVVVRLLGANMLTGIALGLVRAAAVSLVLYAGRAVIEQRPFTVDELQRGMGAFFGEVLNVFFAVWIASMVLGFVAPQLTFVLLLALVVLPVFETVALTPVGGFGMFEAAWRFFARDWAAWLGGHVPLLALVAVYWAASLGLGVTTSVVPGFGGRAQSMALDLVDNSILFILLLIAFIYRGVLFLTLDGTSRFARAQRFGGAPSLR